MTEKISKNDNESWIHILNVKLQTVAPRELEVTVDTTFCVHFFTSKDPITLCGNMAGKEVVTKGSKYRENLRHCLWMPP